MNMESIEIETCKLTFFYVQGSPEKSASQKQYNVSEKIFSFERIPTNCTMPDKKSFG